MISRRKLLLGFAASASLAPIVYFGANSKHENLIAGNFSPESYDLELGKQFLETIFKDNSQKEITAALKNKLPWYNVFLPKLALMHAAKIDYLNGDIVEVDGWILPRVSALFCAVAVLENQNVH